MTQNCIATTNDNDSTFVLDVEKLAVLDAFIDDLPTQQGALIEVLHKAQSLFGYLPEELQLHIAKRLSVPAAEVFGVVSFYSFFTMKPPGKHIINICMGTACFVRGADKLLAKLKSKLQIEAGETTQDRQFTLKDVRCIGACGLAPVITIDEKVFGRINEDDIDGILEKYQQ